MNYTRAVILINAAVRAVSGLYEETGNADVFKTVDQDLKVGDFVVVESGTRWGVTTVKITATDVDVDFDSPKDIKWVVQKIDMPKHEELKKMEAVAIDVLKRGELRKRREDIKKNHLDAVAAGELEDVGFARLGAPALPDTPKE